MMVVAAAGPPTWPSFSLLCTPSRSLALLFKYFFLTFYFIFFSLFGSDKVQENFKSHVLCFLGNERENYCLP